MAFGGKLKWDKLEAKRACRIAIYRDGDIDAESEMLDEIKNGSSKIFSACDSLAALP